MKIVDFGANGGRLLGVETPSQVRVLGPMVSPADELRQQGVPVSGPEMPAPRQPRDDAGRWR